MTTVLIANPAAAGGRVGGRLDRWAEAIRGALGEVELWRTEAPHHAEALAAKAVEQGAGRLLVVGGDGTLSEVVHGLLGTGRSASVELALLPAGTGGDFRRGLTWKNVDEAVAQLPTARATLVDAGRVTVQGEHGPLVRGFANMVSFGVAGLVDRKVNRSRKQLPGTLAFYVATLASLAEYEAARVRITVDGRDLGEHAVTNVCLCNGRWAGGGMLFAPEAKLADGLLDVVIIDHKGALATVGLTPYIYRGTHVALAHVHTDRGRVIRVEPVGGGPAWADVDGEPPGQAPATVEVVPGALALLGLRPELA